MQTIRIVGERSVGKLADALGRALKTVLQVCIGEFVCLDKDSSLPPADMHVVIMEPARVLPERFIEAMLAGKPAPEHCPVQRLVLVGLLPTGDGSTAEVNGVRTVPWLRLLFDAFEPVYIQLPLALSQARVAFASALSDKNREDAWRRDWRRVVVALENLRAKIEESDGGEPQWGTLWLEVDRLSGSEERRQREEHDADDLFRFQRDVDHYYLCAARRRYPHARRFLFIDNNWRPLSRELNLLVKATGDVYYIPDTEPACHRLGDQIVERAKHEARFDLTADAESIVMLRLEAGLPTEERTDRVSLHEDVDFVLVDLFLGQRDSGELADGEQVIRHLHERAPEIPTFVVTRSEEPDVLARCLRIRGASRAVSKRRLLRLPYEIDNYLDKEISPLLAALDTERDGHALVRDTVGLFRTWTTYPDILWHGEKTFHAAEHALEHHMNLWRLANQLLVQAWPDIRPRLSAPGEELFRFLIALWLHDVGSKGDQHHQMGDEVRGVHAWLSGQLIRSNPYLYGLGPCVTPRVEAIARLCEYHQSSCPLDDMSVCVGKPTEGRFSKTLVEMDAESREPPLAGWEALLRLLDAIEHHWTRVGTQAVLRSKTVTLEADGEFYRRKGDKGDPDARNYAKWLCEQPQHMQKHLSVIDVQLRLEREPTLPSSSLRIYPCYAFLNQDDAAEHLPKIGCYVLREWWATGIHMQKHLGLIIPDDPPHDTPRSPDRPYWAIWDAPDLRRLAEAQRHEQAWTLWKSQPGGPRGGP